MNALKNYSSKNDVNICQIVAYKDNKLCLEKHRYQPIFVQTLNNFITSIMHLHKRILNNAIEK